MNVLSATENSATVSQKCKTYHFDDFDDFDGADEEDADLRHQIPLG